LDEARCSGRWILEAPSDPTHSHVEFIKFFDSPKESLVKAQNVAYLFARSYPVFCGEAENGEVINIARHAEADHGRKIFFTLGMASDTR
jgi:lauroyl/myristoyl acyltransferase